MNTVCPRHVEPHIEAALEDSPVVLIQGPRQCGKTTLAQITGKSAGYKYFTFDDEGTRSAATDDPAGFVNALPERSILDEAQLVPGLFPSIKLSIDRNRIPGRFILTGSVNILQMARVKESLAGRMDIIRLHPFSQSELEQTPPWLLDSLFSPDFVACQNPPAESDLMDRVVAGGYPAALRRAKARQANWYQTYVESLVTRDIPAIADIHSLETLPQLLELATAQTAQLLSVNGLASSFQLNRLTIRSYLALLEKMFLLEKIPAWHSNHTKRLVKTPKLHLGDTGVTCALLNLNRSALLENRPLWGHILETFVLQELQRQASAYTVRHTFHHFRSKDGVEVDIVIQRGATALAGVEVKASGTVVSADFRGLRKLEALAGKQFAGGVLFYHGDSIMSFGKKLYALPLKLLWEAP